MKLSKKLLLGTGIGAAVAAAVPFIAGEIMWFGVLTKKGSDVTSKIFGDPPKPPEIPPSYNILDGIAEWYENTPHTEILTVNPKNEIPCAELFEVQGSHKWAIICHGYTSGPSGMAHYAREYYNKGYNVILPYMRGNAKGIKAKNIVTYTMGYQDKYDLLGWIDYAVKADPECEIVLHGESMGAATVMMTVGEKLPENVKCAIEDCGYTSVWDEFSHQIVEMFHLPVFPFLDVAQLCIKRHVDLDFKAASSIEGLKKSKTPMLFIHGEADDFVPFEMVHRNYDAFDGEKDILTIPGADHAVSVTTDPETYFNKVWEFVGKYVSE